MRSETRQRRVAVAIRTLEEILIDLRREPQRLTTAEEYQVRDALTLINRIVSSPIEALIQHRARRY